MTTPGGPGFSQGDDYVAARLSIDIPDDAVEGVREITQAVEAYRTTLEAAARAEADMTRYLEQMAEASKSASTAQQNLSANLQQYLSLASRAGITAPSSGVPQGGAVNPFKGLGAGIGGMETGGMGSPTGERPPNPSDVASQLGNAQSTNPREWLNMQHARGGVTAQDTISISPESIQELATKIARREHEERELTLQTQPVPQGPEGEKLSGAAPANQRISRAGTLAGKVSNELGTGAPGLRGLAARGLGHLANMRKSSQAPGRAGPPATSGADSDIDPSTPGAGGDTPTDEGTMGLSKITKMIPAVGGILTSLLAVFGGIQSGGQWVQGMRNTAGVRGGAAGEGAQVEFKARMLAMNPFITSDQARQIYQAAMSEGYADATGSGPAADNVIDFMSSNLQKMNISVADSVKMLRGQVMGGGKGDPASVIGAVEALASELGAIKSLSRESKISTPDYVAAVSGTKEAMMKAGGGVEGSTYGAMLAEEVGSQDLTTMGQFNELTSSAVSSGPKAAGFLRAFGGPGGTPRRDLGNLLPGAMVGYLVSTGQFDEALRNTMSHFAKIASMHERGDEKSHRNAISVFQQYLAAVAPDHPGVTDYRVAEKMYTEALAGAGGGGDLGPAEGRIAAKGVQAPGGGGRGGGGGGGSSIPFQPEAPANMPASAPDNRGQGPGAVTDTPPGSGKGGNAGGNGGSASVQITLTPEAARLLQVLGPTAVKIPQNKALANQGRAGAQVHSG